MKRFKVKNYELLKLIGSGAGSHIHKARRIDTDEIFAIKIVERKSSADDKFVEQIINEYVIGSRLDHPNIVKYYFLEKVRRFFIPYQYNLIMEYIEGAALDKMSNGNVTDFLKICIQAGSALQYMHEMGYVHSDFKPHNVIITSQGLAKLFDLGLACPRGTKRQRLQGTIDFIAPEQANRGYLDSFTDIYCFGATMYYLLTGRNIPSTLSLFKKTKTSSLRKDVDSAKDLNPNVPSVLDELIMKCLERKKEMRPGSMKEIVDKLQLILEKLTPAKA